MIRNLKNSWKQLQIGKIGRDMHLLVKFRKPKENVMYGICSYLLLICFDFEQITYLPRLFKLDKLFIVCMPLTLATFISILKALRSPAAKQQAWFVTSKSAEHKTLYLRSPNLIHALGMLA